MASTGSHVVLTMNSGSSSLKFGLYLVFPSRIEPIVSGEAEAIGSSSARFYARNAKNVDLISETGGMAAQHDAMLRIIRLLSDLKTPPPFAIAHRIVHGGPRLLKHCMLDDAVLAEIKAATAFAPLHLPAAVSAIEFVHKHFPSKPQIACFDTVFHAHMPDVARILPIPRELRLEGVWRYGFHGLSCESILHQLGTEVPARIIVAHLGNGASVTAIRDGASIDTSMGLTPTGGVIMGTRSGDIDPGVLIHLMRRKKLGAKGLETMLDRYAGLLGISGGISDMRGLHQAAGSDPNAKLAIGMFCYSVRKQIAAMIAAMDGVDLLVFTGGIGEHDGSVRASICSDLSWIGISLDDARNLAANNPIHDAKSRSAVLVLASGEDEQMARVSGKLLRDISGSDWKPINSAQASVKVSDNPSA